MTRAAIFIKRIALLWCALATLTVAFDSAAASATATVQKQNAQAHALLEKALAFYRLKGDDAFAAFTRQSEFTEGDHYVFVVDNRNVLLASGGSSAVLIGRNVSSVLSADVVQAFKAAFATGQAGAAQPNPAQSEPVQALESVGHSTGNGKFEHRQVIFQRVGERIVAVTETLPRASAEQARALLEKAATALQQDEKGTLAAINNLQGGFLEDTLYVFVVDLNTSRYVAHGFSPRLVHVDFRGLKAPDSKPVGVPMLAQARKPGVSEYAYRWRNPVTEKIDTKHAFLRKAGHFMVAVSYYGAR